MAKSAAVVEFEQNEIASIKSAYNTTIFKRTRYYHLSQLFAGVACLLIPLAILTSHVWQKEKLFFSANIYKEKKKIILTGSFPEKQKVKVSYLSKEPEVVELSDFKLYKEFYLTEEEIKNSKIEVYVEYEEANGRHRLIKDLSL